MAVKEMNGWKRPKIRSSAASAGCNSYRPLYILELTELLCINHLDIPLECTSWLSRPSRTRASRKPRKLQKLGVLCDGCVEKKES